MRPSRRFLWLCFAGLGLVVMAVAVPAVPADVALIIIGFLIVLLVLDWAMSVGPKGVAVAIEGEREVFVGETTVINLIVSPTHKRGELPRALMAARIKLPVGFAGPPQVQLHRAGDRNRCSLTLRARRRGVWHVNTIWLVWKSRFGLIDFAPTHNIDCRISVVPNIRPVTSGQIDLELNTSIYGIKDISQRGEGSDFHQLNEFVQGMDPRSIDWKHSARHRKLVAKEMRAERNHQIILALDNGYLMREEVDGVPKIDHKINAALALAWAGVKGGDQVGLFAFDARPRLYAPPQPGRLAFSRLRSHMAALEYKSIETNHTLALSHLHQKLKKRSLIVVFSDFVDPLTAELLVEHMAILNRHHVVVFISLKDPLLEALSGRKAGSINDVARSVSASNMLQERRAILDGMSALGIYVIEADPGNVTPKLVSTYLDIKAREVI